MSTDFFFGFIILFCLSLSLSPSLPHTELRRVVLPVIFLFVLCCHLAVLMWFLWITPGSGNANFLYFQTLLYTGCNAFWIIECVGSVRRIKAVAAAILVPIPTPPPSAAAAAAAAVDEKKTITAQPAIELTQRTVAATRSADSKL